jgi:hypothetical protein
MSNFRYLSLMILLGCGAFVAAFAFKQWRSPTVTSAQAEPPFGAPDSMQLASIGLAPGRQLIAYVFGGSRCAICRKTEVKEAVAALKGTLRRAHGSSFRTVMVVGVAVNTDLGEGLGYLKSIGLDSFDEITTGGGWQNEEVIRWIQRGKHAEAAVPLVIVVTRTMDAQLAPLRVSYSVDSILAVVQGRTELLDWVNGSAPLRPLAVAKASY